MLGMLSEKEWKRREEEANKFMESRSAIDRVLIEVAAQHPPVDGEKPGEEFSARLMKGRELSMENRNRGMEVEIYVPGSRHMWDGVADKISLSEVGMRFLIEKGMPKKFLHGEDLNVRYKGSAPLPGVYNSADECFVAASYFKDGDFGQLLSVVSPVQLPRKALHYIWFGVIPQFYTAPTRKTFHNWTDEASSSIPYILNVDPDWQSANSERGISSRMERMPGYRRV